MAEMALFLNQKKVEGKENPIWDAPQMCIKNHLQSLHLFSYPHHCLIC